MDDRIVAALERIAAALEAQTAQQAQMIEAVEKRAAESAESTGRIVAAQETCARVVTESRGADRTLARARRVALELGSVLAAESPATGRSDR